MRRWSLPGSNRRPPACKAGALPTELRPRARNGRAAHGLAPDARMPRRVSEEGRQREEGEADGRRRGEPVPVSRAEVSNFEIVTHYFDDAADRLGLRDDVAAVLKSSYREVQVQIPIRRDDGRIHVYQGFRVQHN